MTDLGRRRLKDFGETRGGYTPSAPVRSRRRERSTRLRTNLPSVRGPLIGRDQDWRKSIERLLGDSRLITLTGAGGNGKTRLALAVAENLLDRLVDGVFLVELAEIERAVPAAETQPARGRGISRDTWTNHVGEGRSFGARTGFART